MIGRGKRKVHVDICPRRKKLLWKIPRKHRIDLEEVILLQGSEVVAMKFKIKVRCSTCQASEWRVVTSADLMQIGKLTEVMNMAMGTGKTRLLDLSKRVAGESRGR